MRIIRTFQDFFQEDPCIKITDCLSCLKSGCYLVDFWGEGIEKCVDFITLTSAWSRDGWFSFIGIGDEGMCPIRHQWLATPPDTVLTSSVAESNFLLLKTLTVFIWLTVALIGYFTVKQVRKDFWPSMKTKEKSGVQPVEPEPAREPVLEAQRQGQMEEGEVALRVEAPNDNNNDEWDPWEGNVWRLVIEGYYLPRQRG